MRALAYMYDVSREALYRKIKIVENNNFTRIPCPCIDIFVDHTTNK